MESVCCENLIDKKNIISPFKKMIVFEWYDGIVQCVSQCCFCKKIFLCQLVAWNHNFETRVFICIEIPSNKWSELIKSISMLEKPSWPVWIPSVRGSEFKVSNIIDKFSLEIQKTVSSINPVSFILASHKLNESILSAKKNENLLDSHYFLLEIEEIADKPVEYHNEWFKKLDI